MLELLNIPDRTTQEEQELKEVASVFNVKERKIFKRQAKHHTSVILYNPNNEFVHQEQSIRKMAEYLGMPIQTLTYKSKAQIPLNIKGYEGYVVARKGDKLNEIAPDGMKKCGRCGCIKDKSEFINLKNGKETLQCEKCRSYYIRKYHQMKEGNANAR